MKSLKRWGFFNCESLHGPAPGICLGVHSSSSPPLSPLVLTKYYDVYMRLMRYIQVGSELIASIFVLTTLFPAQVWYYLPWFSHSRSKLNVGGSSMSLRLRNQRELLQFEGCLLKCWKENKILVKKDMACRYSARQKRSSKACRNGGKFRQRKMQGSSKYWLWSVDTE